MKNLDTIFAVEFGQLLENFLFSSADRDRQRKVICSCLGLKNENQLAQRPFPAIGLFFGNRQGTGTLHRKSIKQQQRNSGSKI